MGACVVTPNIFTVNAAAFPSLPFILKIFCFKLFSINEQKSIRLCLVGQKQGIESPDDALLSKDFRKGHKGFNVLLQLWNVGFNPFCFIVVKGKLKITDNTTFLLPS